MSESFGPGVSRTLSALQRQFQAVVWQPDKPPLDSELNLMAQVDQESLREVVRAQLHSGFLLDPTRAIADFVTLAQSSNMFDLGLSNVDESQPVVAAVNGWIVPVVGTDQSDSISNRVRLSPPPASDSRIDLVFLEVWQALVSPNPSASNKPSASTVWRYGNVEFGGTNLPDDLEDPAIGFETTKRVQLQYRIRVHGSGAGAGAGVALDVYPDGLGDPTILAQGTASGPVAGMPYQNMREELGDPSLWRAGDGDPENALGTVDGYAYAVPICAVFRRNSSIYATVEAGTANQNGGFDRNAVASTFADPRTGAKVLTTATLTYAITASDTSPIAVSDLSGSGFDTLTTAQLLAGVYIQVGAEIIGPISAVSSTTLLFGAGCRGRGGTMAVPHDAGATVQFFCARPDGLFADQVAAGDILDLRHGVTFGEWDYNRLLIHNLSSLFLNRMRTAYKQSYTGETQGVEVLEASYLWASPGAIPASAQGVDGPDGIRTTFSDAATVQSDVTMMLTGVVSVGANPSLDAGVDWDVGVPFQPSGFGTAAGYANGMCMFLNIGGTDGNAGARLSAAHDSAARVVRFVAPYEMWKSGTSGACGLRAPFTLRWISESGFDPVLPQGSAQPGPMYPTASSNFERPFMVLGGTLNAASNVSAPILDEPTSGVFEVELPGVNFDTVGGWWNGDAVDTAALDGITNTVLRGQRNLYDMLTKDGTDTTGASSEVYLVLYGDTANPSNNGVVKVVGAGTVAAGGGYTQAVASAANRVRVQFVVQGVSAWASTPGSLTNAELRSQYTNVEDGAGGVLGPTASAIVVLTDIEGADAGSPWNGLVSAPTTSRAVLSTTLVYNPGRGATPRVPNRVWTVAGVSLGSSYLRQSQAALDPSWAAQVGVPTSQAQSAFDTAHIGSWNRLPSLGLSAPDAPNYGGGVAQFSEQTREAEVFLDAGSKSLTLRPYRSATMTLEGFDFAAAPWNVTPTLLGTATYPGPNPTLGTPKDGAGIFTPLLSGGFALPPEFVPRFGRHDIPFRQGSDSAFLEGINHLFVESNNTATNTALIGGRDNATGTSQPLLPLFVQTGSGTGYAYGQYGTVTVGTPAYQGRLFYAQAIVSSDLGRGMSGIQLPPYIGVARLQAVYDRRDFITHGGNTASCTNLLRRDATKQTLFILQGGAEDVTGSADDHTYIVPENSLDIRISPEYMTGEAFADLSYVVMLTAFGFARGFINKNNIVLARAHNGSGATVTAGTLTGIEMVLPLPAGVNDQFLVGYTRTPYQGDPFMTRAGATRVISDYTARYGQVAVSDQFQLETPIQQFTADGDLIPTTPNRRPLQVLAALDFYTTLGTGKVGGAVYAGTVTDCGHAETTPDAALRRPVSTTAPAWRTVLRTFSEGQPSSATAAAIRLVVRDNSLVNGNRFSIAGNFREAGTDFAVGGSASVTAANIAALVNADPILSQIATAYSPGTAEVLLTSTALGAAGNSVQTTIVPTTALGDLGLQLVRADGRPLTGINAAFMTGGVDVPANAGTGTSLLTLTGLTERLPLGILLNDCDFLCENPMNDNASALATLPVGVNVPQDLLPLANSDQEYTPFVGGPGQWIALSDGGILSYTGYSESTPSGSRAFRLYRGGGSAFVVSEPHPGGPLSWVAGSWPASSQPVLKGAVLACKALLVRNLPETAFASGTETSPGSEVQMVIVTYGIAGPGNTQSEGLSLSGEISPTGYGEGFAAADRYRIEGRPMTVSRVRDYPPGDADPAVLPTTDSPSTTTC